MQRRAFLRSAACGAAALTAGAAPVNKRERMMQWLAGKTDPGYTPAAFFLHFGPAYKNGSAAARRHMEFFRHTDMDFVKVQFEQTYERQPFLQKPADWSKLALRKKDFYEPLLVTVRELVRDAKRDALILMTLYSPYMCAGHCATSPVLRQHLAENPDAVKKGMEVLIESQMIFVRACIEAGVDGFYMSTQGSEVGQLASPALFAKYVKPADLVAMNEVQKRCAFNILHVCDYNAPYANYDAVRDYPGHVVNCNPKLTGGELGWAKIQSHFGRPCMGGLDRHGILANGTNEQVTAKIQKVIRSAPKQFMLGADCTVAGELSWDRLRHAIGVAHRTGRA
jgi:uroporphyrinogen decarboxylase